MNVGAGQYRSSSVAITMLPIIPPNRAATIDMATPVALQIKQYHCQLRRTMLSHFVNLYF